jgi:Protein of unknown function (DUF1329)
VNKISRIIWSLAAVLAAFVLPAIGRAQSTDRSELTQFLNETANQGPPPPVGIRITMANWQQYKQFMPFGMVKLFEGKYQWKMPANVELDVGPARYGNLPKTWVEATEKYGNQDTVEVLPNGHFKINNYHGGVVFPDPSEPHKGFKILANVFFAHAPAIFGAGPDNTSAIWFVDRFGNISEDTFDFIYRQSGWDTDAGFPADEDYAPGTWYTEWFMEETPEQARYTATLALYYKDQEEHEVPDNYVFVPSLRRSLRLSASARCSPLFGSEWTNDDAKINGFNGGTAIFDADFLGDRKQIELVQLNSSSGDFPGNYAMPLGFPKPSWGKWEIRDATVIDAHRIPSETKGYCYGNRVLWVDKEFWLPYWVDLFDSSHKLWKVAAYENATGDVPTMGHIWVGVAAMNWDLQNTHVTIWSPWGNPQHRGHWLNRLTPVEYQDGIKFGSPAGLMQILR